MLTEAMVLAAAGGAAGALLAAWSVQALVAASPVTAAGFGAIDVDPGVLGFTALLTVATGLVFGLAPAAHTARTDLTTSLKDTARGAGSAGGRRLRGVLVASEVAVALVLLVGAGLLLRSFVQLLDVDPGYRTDHVLAVPLGAPEARYAGRPEIASFYDRVLERASALPGVRRAGLVSILPLSPGDNDTNFIIEGRPEPTQDYDRPVAWYRMASAGYFETMGMRLVRGRGITDADTTGAPGVVVVNETFVRRYFPGEDPIGHRLQFGRGDNARHFTIVGVAADILQRGLDAPPQVELYLPYRQLPERFMTLVLWTNGDPAALTPAVRGAVHAIDPLLPLTDVATMAELRARSVAQPRFLLDVLAAFALAALLLAALGVYGVVSYGVAQRTGEIGIRIALGADRGRVLRLVVGDGMRLALAGVAVGVAGAFLATRALASLLFHLSPTDPLTFAATAALLAAVAALASVVPAWRATRVDPMRALRTE
jgi:predicted permease